MSNAGNDSEAQGQAEKASLRVVRRRRLGLAMAVAALGVVFGDIGTSPLYALQVTFTADNSALPLNQDNVYGAISLIFWAITLVVGVKYLFFIMRADNSGEGGGMALISLIRQLHNGNRRIKASLLALGLCWSRSLLRRRHDYPSNLGDLRS